MPHCLEDPDFVAILKEVRNEPTLDSDAAASDIKAFSFQSDKEDVAKKRLADFAKTNAPSNVGIQTKLHFSMQVRTPTSSPKSSHTFCSPDSHKEKDGRDEDFSEDSQAKDRPELETKDEKQPKDLGSEPINDDSQKKDQQELKKEDEKQPKDLGSEPIKEDSQEKDQQELKKEDEKNPERQDPEAVKEDSQEKDQKELKKKNEKNPNGQDPDSQEKDQQELKKKNEKNPKGQDPEPIEDDSQEKDQQELKKEDEKNPEDHDPEDFNDDGQENQELEEGEESCEEEEEALQLDSLGQEKPSLQTAGGVPEVHPSEDANTVNLLLCVADPWCKLIIEGEKTWEIRSKQTHKRALPSLRSF